MVMTEKHIYSIPDKKLILTMAQSVESVAPRMADNPELLQMIKNTPSDEVFPEVLTDIITEYTVEALQKSIHSAYKELIEECQKKDDGFEETTLEEVCGNTWEPLLGEMTKKLIIRATPANGEGNPFSWVAQMIKTIIGKQEGFAVEIGLWGQTEIDKSLAVLNIKSYHLDENTGEMIMDNTLLSGKIDNVVYSPLADNTSVCVHYHVQGD